MRFVFMPLVFFLLACDESRPPAPPPPPGDGSVTQALRLRLLDEIDGRLRLRTEESVELRFILENPETEEPVEGASIVCAMAGADGDSSASSASTDAAGEATVILQTSIRPAYFALRCAATRSNLVELGAAVSPSFEFEDAPFAADYPGERNLELFRAMIVVGASCEDAPGMDA